jgi:hypothetical protein
VPRRVDPLSREPPSWHIEEAAAVQRGSDKHGPREDEQLQHETEGLVRSGHATHTEPWRETEPATREPDETRYPDPREPGTPAGLTAADVELRSQLASAIQRLDFPARRDAVLDCLRAVDAPAELVDRVSRLPADRSYEHTADLFDDLDLNERQRF